MEEQMATLHKKVDELTGMVRILTDKISEQEKKNAALAEILDDSQKIGRDLFNTTIIKLDEMERQGYFDLANGMTYVVDQIVTSFDKDDVLALGDNIVTILKTVRSMTQPEVLGIATQVAGSFREPEPTEEMSAWALLRELGDPKVRKGMARMLNMVKAVADQPQV